MPLLVKMLWPSLLTWLQSTVKNPKSIAAEKQRLIELRDTLNVILSGM